MAHLQEKLRCTRAEDIVLICSLKADTFRGFGIYGLDDFFLFGGCWVDFFYAYELMA